MPGSIRSSTTRSGGCGGPGRGGGAAGGHVDGEARPVQTADDDLGDGGIVVHDEHTFTLVSLAVVSGRLRVRPWTSAIRKIAKSLMSLSCS